MKLTHPDDPGVSIDVADQHLAEYQSQGWVEAAEEPKGSKPTDTEKGK